jgi:hypothetical protein
MSAAGWVDTAACSASKGAVQTNTDVRFLCGAPRTCAIAQGSNGSEADVGAIVRECLFCPRKRTSRSRPTNVRFVPTSEVNHIHISGGDRRLRDLSDHHSGSTVVCLTTRMISVDR